MLAYSLLLGPGFATAVVLPPTLVTRWFEGNGGRVLGFVSAPIVVTVVPLIATWALQAVGLAGTYRLLAVMAAVASFSCLFIIDRPATAQTGPTFDSAPASGTVAQSSRPTTMVQLVRNPLYWALILPAIASTSGSMVLSAHMVPMFQSWGLSLALAASLLSVQSFVGMFGTVFFGWLADRIGGVMAMLIIVGDSAVLWLLLLLKPPFLVTAPLIGFMGFHGAGVVPVLGVMLGEAFGRENFSRAYGLMNFVSLPFSVLCVPAAAMMFAQTGSYAGMIAVMAASLAAGAALLLGVRRRAAMVVATA